MYIVLISVGSLLLLFIAAQLHRSKRASSKVVRVTDDKCTGCRRCLKWCRRKALGIVTDETGAHVTVNPHKCTACGDCVGVCKFNALEIVRREQP
jgi:ferredoxin